MKPVTILYADDDENDLYFMHRAFAAGGTAGRLIVVENGRDAVAYLNGDPPYADRTRFPFPDVLLLDGKMPFMSGIEVLSWVKAHAEYKQLPVIMFTSSTIESDIAAARTRGANGYIIKPANADDLRDFRDYLIAVAECRPPAKFPGDRI